MAGHAGHAAARVAARVSATADGYRVWTNASGGYVLKRGKPPGTTFSTTMTSVAGRQQRNGFILLSGGDPRRTMVRAGIEFGARSLTVIGPGGMRKRGSKKIQWDGKSPVEVTVTVDFKAHKLTAVALGQRVEVDLPEAWTELTASGYGASNAETEFTKLVTK